MQYPHAALQIPSCLVCGSNTDDNRSLCHRCRRDLWLSEHANAIERYTSQGFSFKTAIEKVRKENGSKRDCLCCGEAVNRKALFCSKTKRCRSARDRMKYLLHKKHVPRELALKTVLEDL